jgi:hypothetical protein
MGALSNASCLMDMGNTSMISRDGAKNVLAGLYSGEKFDPSQNVLGDSPGKGVLNLPTDDHNFFGSHSDKKDKTGGQAMSSLRADQESMYQNQSVILEKARRPPRPAKKVLPQTTPAKKGEKTPKTISNPTGNPESPIKQANLEARLMEAQNDTPIPDHRQIESNSDTQARLSLCRPILKLTSYDSEGESFLAGPGFDAGNTSTTNVLNMNDISEINYGKDDDLRASRKEVPNQILLDLVSKNQNITEEDEEHANSNDSGIVTNKQITETDLTENTKKPYLDQNEKGGFGNKFESLQVESGPDGQSSL